MAPSASVIGNGIARPVRKSWLPGGDLGVYLTLFEMQRVARNAVGHPLLVQAVTDATGGDTDPRVIWVGLRDWLTTHTQFQFDRDDPLAQRDPDLIEVIHTPLDQLFLIAKQGVAEGDCDDVATLAAALALTAGQRVRFAVFGFVAPGPSTAYHHVIAEMATPGGWADFDITRQPTSPRATRRATLEV